MKIIKKDDKNYPERLLQIKDPPKELYVLGSEELLNNNSIAIVGTRKCTEYGEKYTKLFAKKISESGITVISGLAVGIDTIAHINSMEELGRTIAVLGSGFEHIYPKENTYLFQKILENGGCIISEYPPETPVDKSRFPKRNRIISGISMGVLVVEALYRSGSTITAKHAINQKKEVFCIPNRLGESKGYSTNLLIKNGANLVTEPEDIINLYLSESEKLIEISEEHKEIYNLIGELPITANEIAKTTNKTISQIMNSLTILELEGVIKSIGGNRFIRK